MMPNDPMPVPNQKGCGSHSKRIILCSDCEIKDDEPCKKFRTDTTRFLAYREGKDAPFYFRYTETMPDPGTSKLIELAIANGELQAKSFLVKSDDVLELAVAQYIDLRDEEYRKKVKE